MRNVNEILIISISNIDRIFPYCYKLVEDNDKMCLRKIEINEYSESHSYYKVQYRFDGKSNGVSNYSHDYVDAKQIDKLAYSKIFTFNPDPENVYRTIEEELERKFRKAEAAFANAESRLEKWNSFKDEVVS